MSFFLRELLSFSFRRSGFRPRGLPPKQLTLRFTMQFSRCSGGLKWTRTTASPAATPLGCHECQPVRASKQSTGLFCAFGTSAHLTLIAFGPFGSLALRLSSSFLFAAKRNLVGSSGLEPPTSRLSGVRSNQLSYEPIPFRPRPFLRQKSAACVLCFLFPT